MVAKHTKSSILKAIKSAMSKSQASGGKPASVDLPGWDGYELRSSKGRMHRIQQHPSTFVKVQAVSTGAIVWSTTSGYLDAIARDIAERAKQFDGWCGPTTFDHVPITHPARTDND